MYPSYGQGGYTTPQYPNNYQYNPYVAMAQQRLQNIEQQYPQFSQQQPQTIQQQPTQNAQPIVASIVTSVDEAKAVPANLQGARQIFFDTSNGLIYTKQFNIQTGASDFAVYQPQQAEAPAAAAETAAPTDPQPAPVVDTSMDDIKLSLSDISTQLNDLREVIKNGGIKHAGTSTNDGAKKSTSKRNDTAANRDVSTGDAAESNN